MTDFNPFVQHLAERIIMQERLKSDCYETNESVLFTYLYASMSISGRLVIFLKQRCLSKIGCIESDKTQGKIFSVGLILT